MEFGSRASGEKDLIAETWPRLVDGFGTVLSAVGVALAVLHLTKGLGFPTAERRAAMLPFNLQPPINTLFQYAVALATIFGVGAVYARGVLPRMGPVARRLDLFGAAVLPVVAWWFPTASVAMGALGARAALAVWLAIGPGRSRIETLAPLARLAVWGPAAALASAAHLLAFALPSGANAAVDSAPAWLLALVAAPVVLFLVEEISSPAALAWQRRVGVLVALVAISVLCFETRAVYFDASVIVGPANDLMLGKDMPDTVVSAYGFVFSYFLAAVFRLFGVTDLFRGLSVVGSLAFIVCYMAIFAYLLRRMRRLSLCFAALLLIVAVFHFDLHVPIYWVPQCGFLRFGWVLPLFLILYALDERPDDRRLEGALACCAALALFWTLEVGVYVALGLTGALGRELLLREPGDRAPLRRIAKVAAAVGALLALVFLRVVVRHGHAPAWADLLHFQRAFSAGLAMFPIKSFERWPIPIVVYLVTVFVSLTSPRVRHGSAWTFLALFGLAAMAYPLGKTSNYDLSRVVLPALLLAASFVGFVVKNGNQLRVEIEGREFSLAPVISIGFLATSAVLICVVHADVARPLADSLAIAASHRKPIADSSPSWQAFVGTPERRAQFARDLEAIDAVVPPDEGLPILSKNDTLYYVFARRKSLYKNSFYSGFFFKADLDQVAKDLLSSPVGHMFLDNSTYQVYENRIDQSIAAGIWGRVAPHYKFVRHVGLLDLYQRLPAGE